MSNEIFRPLNGAERRAFTARYLNLLKTRNGLPEKDGRRFTVREEFFQKLEANPMRRSGPPAVDQATFTRNEELAVPEPGLDERTLWALAVAKSNRSERFGVEYSLQRRGGVAGDVSNPHTFLEIEEFYHTRILRDVVETLGITMRQRDPHPRTRFMIKLMTVLPKYLGTTLIFAAELAGVAAFRLLLRKGRELFADQPEPLRRIESLFQQILTDEVGHVYFARSELGPVRLWIARTVLPVVVRYLKSDVPELERLFGAHTIMEEIRKADLHSELPAGAVVPA